MRNEEEIQIRFKFGHAFSTGVGFGTGHERIDIIYAILESTQEHIIEPNEITITYQDIIGKRLLCKDEKKCRTNKCYEILTYAIEKAIRKSDSIEDLNELLKDIQALIIYNDELN